MRFLFPVVIFLLSTLNFEMYSQDSDDLFSNIDSTQYYIIKTKTGKRYNGLIKEVTESHVFVQAEDSSILTLPKSMVSSIKGQFQLNEEELYQIITKDGNEYIGVLVEETSNTILLETSSIGTVTIQKSQIRSQSNVSDNVTKEGNVWPDNYMATRYFWQANGYGLKKGEGYYQNIWIFFNQVSVGVTDAFSVSFGTIPLFFFGEVTPVWVVPKLSIPLVEDKVNLGLGVLAGTVLGEGSGFAVPFGVATVGGRDNNLSVGLGYGFANGEMSQSPLITISGMVRVGKKGYLLTENFIFSSDEGGFGMVMLGGRTVNPSVSIDYGLIIPVGTGGGFVIPWLGISIPF